VMTVRLSAPTRRRLIRMDSVHRRLASSLRWRPKSMRRRRPRWTSGRRTVADRDGTDPIARSAVAVRVAADSRRPARRRRLLRPNHPRLNDQSLFPCRDKRPQRLCCGRLHVRDIASPGFTRSPMTVGWFMSQTFDRSSRPGRERCGSGRHQRRHRRRRGPRTAPRRLGRVMMNI
jgi:hypothetical protein